MKPEKLTIEHLAAYLPYELKVWFNTSQIVKTHSMSAAGISDVLRYTTNYKPILRRPENVSKEELIESGLDRLMVTGICKYNITREYSDDDINRYDIHHFGKDTDIPYDVIKVLFSLHVDVFGLIEAGLAIDINALEEKK